MFGGNSDNNPCDVTCSEVKKRYKCNKLKMNNLGLIEPSVRHG